MSFSDQSGDGGSISDINVTPLVDVMLVLLVIFMVTAPILQQGITVQLPRARAAAMTGDDKGLIVSLSPTNELFLNDERVSRQDLGAKVAAILRETPDKQVFLRADEKVSYGDVMVVMATLKEAGAQRLGMVTEPPSPPK